MTVFPHESGVVDVRQVFSTSPELLFRAWTEPSAFKEWWRPGPFRIVELTMDVRPGGSYEVQMESAEGRVQRLEGRYVVVVPPSQLVLTWKLHGSAADDGYDALLSLHFKSVPGGTELALRHERLNPLTKPQFEAGWHSLLAGLITFTSQGVAVP